MKKLLSFSTINKEAENEVSGTGNMHFCMHYSTSISPRNLPHHCSFDNDKGRLLSSFTKQSFSINRKIQPNNLKISHIALRLLNCYYQRLASSQFMIRTCLTCLYQYAIVPVSIRYNGCFLIEMMRGKENLSRIERETVCRKCKCGTQLHRHHVIMSLYMHICCTRGCDAHLSAHCSPDPIDSLCLATII